MESALNPQSLASMPLVLPMVLLFVGTTQPSLALGRDGEIPHTETNAPTNNGVCVHGTWNKDRSECICDSGWKTSIQQDTFQSEFFWCNERAYNDSSSEESGSSFPTSLSELIHHPLFFVVVMLLVTLLVGCCCGVFFLRRGTQEKREQQEVGARGPIAFLPEYNYNHHRSGSLQMQPPSPVPFVPQPMPTGNVLPNFSMHSSCGAASFAVHPAALGLHQRRAPNEPLMSSPTTQTSPYDQSMQCSFGNSFTTQLQQQQQQQQQLQHQVQQLQIQQMQLDLQSRCKRNSLGRSRVRCDVSNYSDELEIDAAAPTARPLNF
uniref:Uncharacterized protein n=1 Tax=Trypanosoma congolense (strain IL3000) TaxID=1068625 RepID=G0UZL9_TRYCI|nr:conserved hypothetical protein [Trypanosoma congolense IL3000]